MFSTSRAEGLSAARRLLRGFAGAPDPRRQAQQFYSALTHAEGWSKAEEGLILELGAWLQSRPALGELKARCEALAKRLP